MDRKEYIRLFQLHWIKQRRNDYIASQGGICKNCGSKEDLEIDHIDPSLKTFDPKNIWSRKKEVREKELSKCQILCKKCHFKKSFPTHQEHGYQTYQCKKCRCDICKKANADRKRMLYHRRKALGLPTRNRSRPDK